MTTTELQIGDVMPEGDEHASYIYAGADEKGELWFSKAPQPMDHYEAADWARAQGGSLPTRKEGKHLDSVKRELGRLFHLSGPYPGGCFWLAEPAADGYGIAWRQDLSAGSQSYEVRLFKLPVLCVRRRAE